MMTKEEYLEYAGADILEDFKAEDYPWTFEEHFDKYYRDYVQVITGQLKLEMERILNENVR